MCNIAGALAAVAGAVLAPMISGGNKNQPAPSGAGDAPAAAEGSPSVRAAGVNEDIEETTTKSTPVVRSKRSRSSSRRNTRNPLMIGPYGSRRSGTRLPTINASASGKPVNL